MTTKQTKYEIIDRDTGLLLHTSHTDLELKDSNQMKSLLCNTFWTPLYIVHQYHKDPDSLLLYKITNGKNNRTYKTKISYKHKEIN